jgi:hypothetical protein
MVAHRFKTELHWVKMSRPAKRLARQVLPYKRPCRVAAGPSAGHKRSSPPARFLIGSIAIAGSD